MTFRHRITLGFLTLTAGGLLAGCPAPTEGIDLTTRGGVLARISRQSGSGVADASASFYDTMAGLFNNPGLVLQSGQRLLVNGVPLTAPALLPAQNYATVNAVTAPSAYTLVFENNGAVSQMTAVPPAEVAITAPTDGASVSKSGFAIQWTPGTDPSATVGVHVYGQIPDPNSPGATVGSYAFTATVADSGSVNVGSADLAELLPGPIEIQVSRERVVPQTLGLAAGTVTLECWQQVVVTLGN
jgi:hypothetical protein